MKKIDQYQRKAAFADLEQFDYLAKENDFIEVTEWANGDGWDVNISANHDDQTFHITHGQFKALKKLIKELEK
jgi:hypothetical protein